MTAAASAQTGGGCKPQAAPGSLADLLDGDPPPCPGAVADVTPAQSAASFQNGHDEVVGASKPVPGASSIEPGLQEHAQSFRVTGSLITGEVAKAASDGFLLRSTEALHVKPVNLDLGVTAGTRVGGDSVLFANAFDGSDLVIRPTAIAISMFVQVRSPKAARTFSWTIDSQGGRMSPGEDGSVFIRDSDDRPLAAVQAPSATDAADIQVPSKYVISGDTLTLTVSPPSDANVSYPLVAQVGLAATGDLGRWATYAPEHTVAADGIGDGSLRAVQGVERDGGCTVGATSTTPPGAIIQMRELAYRDSTCQFLFETGKPPLGSLDVISIPTDGGSDSTEKGAADQQLGRLARGSGRDRVRRTSGKQPIRRAAAPRYRRNVGYYKSIWEDPIQLDVNWVLAKTDWRWGGGCVHNPVRNSGYFDQLGKSGWTVRDRPDVIGDATCRHSKSYMTNALFRNLIFCSAISGTYKPPTYTQYSRTAVYGQPNGTMHESFLATKKGGCQSLLHYDSIRINDYTP